MPQIPSQRARVASIIQAVLVAASAGNSWLAQQPSQDLTRIKQAAVDALVYMLLGAPALPASDPLGTGAGGGDGANRTGLYAAGPLPVQLRPGERTQALRVLNFMRRHAEIIDKALLRRFTTAMLAAIRPPYSVLFVDEVSLLARILLAGCCCCRAGHAERNLLRPHLFFVCAD